MDSYQYIWDPIQKQHIRSNTETGLKVIKSYMMNLKGGGKHIKRSKPIQTLGPEAFLPNPLRQRFAKKIRPRCINYFVDKKEGKKTKKVYKGKRDKFAPCPDSLLKHKNGKPIKGDVYNWISEDWDIKHPFSKKAIINKDYKCKPGKKNKRACIKKHMKSRKCIDCLDSRISTISYQMVTENHNKEWLQTNRQILEKTAELKEYLENMNLYNSGVLKNK